MNRRRTCSGCGLTNGWHLAGCLVEIGERRRAAGLTVGDSVLITALVMAAAFAVGAVVLQMVVR